MALAQLLHEEPPMATTTTSSFALLPATSRKTLGAWDRGSYTHGLGLVGHDGFVMGYDGFNVVYNIFIMGYGRIMGSEGFIMDCYGLMLIVDISEHPIQCDNGIKLKAGMTSHSVADHN